MGAQFGNEAFGGLLDREPAAAGAFGGVGDIATEVVADAVGSSSEAAAPHYDFVDQFTIAIEGDGEALGGDIGEFC